MQTLTVAPWRLTVEGLALVVLAALILGAYCAVVDRLLDAVVASPGLRSSRHYLASRWQRLLARIAAEVR